MRNSMGWVVGNAVRGDNEITGTNLTTDGADEDGLRSGGVFRKVNPVHDTLPTLRLRASQRFMHGRG